MPITTDSLNRRLYDLLKTRGYDPIPKDAEGKTTPVADEADVIKFTFKRDNEPVDAAWITIDSDKTLTVYYDDDVMQESVDLEPGQTGDFTQFLQLLKSWAQRKQLGFKLDNSDHLASDMAQRAYMKKKEKIAENKNTTVNETISEAYKKGDLVTTVHGMKGIIKGIRQTSKGTTVYDVHPHGEHKGKWGGNYVGWHHPDDLKLREEVELDEIAKYRAEQDRLKAERLKEDWQKAVLRKHGPVGILPENIAEGYYPMGKKASYSDAVPTTKIVLQHTRQIEEGEQRYRNIAKIFVENVEGERFAVPTLKPGIARVYARHIAEGGTPYDEKGKHITSLVEEYTKMAGFVRATRNGQFNESAQRLVTEGINHYQSLRETLHKMTGHRGYNTYFESWTPTLNEESSDDESLSDMFMEQMLDPRIESVMPILSRLKKNITEVSEINELSEWADSIIEATDPTSIPEEKEDDIEDDITEDLGPEQKRVGQLGPTEKIRSRRNCH